VDFYPTTATYQEKTSLFIITVVGTWQSVSFYEYEVATGSCASHISECLRGVSCAATH
jgi:hypothetical protein